MILKYFINNGLRYDLFLVRWQLIPNKMKLSKIKIGVWNIHVEGLNFS